MGPKKVQLFVMAAIIVIIITGGSILTWVGASLLATLACSNSELPLQLKPIFYSKIILGIKVILLQKFWIFMSIIWNTGTHMALYANKRKFKTAIGISHHNIYNLYYAPASCVIAVMTNAILYASTGGIEMAIMVLNSIIVNFLLVSFLTLAYMMSLGQHEDLLP